MIDTSSSYSVISESGEPDEFEVDHDMIFALERQNTLDYLKGDDPDSPLAESFYMSDFNRWTALQLHAITMTNMKYRLPTRYVWPYPAYLNGLIDYKVELLPRS